MNRAIRARNPQRLEGVNTTNHPFVGLKWQVHGSAKEPYEIEMHDKGFTCTCPAFAFQRGPCKHIKTVAKLFDWEEAPEYV